MPDWFWPVRLAVGVVKIDRFQGVRAGLLDRVAKAVIDVGGALPRGSVTVSGRLWLSYLMLERFCAASLWVESRFNWSKVCVVTWLKRVGDRQHVAVFIVGKGRALAHAAHIGQAFAQGVIGRRVLALGHAAGVLP